MCNFSSSSTRGSHGDALDLAAHLFGQTNDGHCLLPCLYFFSFARQHLPNTSPKVLPIQYIDLTARQPAREAGVVSSFIEISCFNRYLETLLERPIEA